MSLYNRNLMFRDRVRLSILLIVCSMIALPSSGQDIAVSTATVPVIGTVKGLDDIIWRTDVALRNDLPFPVEVVLTLPGVPDDPFYFSTVPARDTIIFRDIAFSTFGVVDRLSPLRVTTIGSTSVTVAAVVNATTVDGPAEPQVLTVQYGENRPMIETLTGLSINETFRTNLGLVNPTDEDALVVLALQKVPGRNIAVVRQTIPPRRLIQLPIQDFFPLLTEGENLTVVVEHTNPGAYVYASVIAGATGNARYYGPR